MNGMLTLMLGAAKSDPNHLQLTHLRPGGETTSLRWARVRRSRAAQHQGRGTSAGKGSRWGEWHAYPDAGRDEKGSP